MSDFDNLTIIDKLNITLSNLNMTHLIGKIKIYAGTTLPAGYVWCDGTNGTPDLKNNKFIISDQSTGSQQQTGNNSFLYNMISHTHTVQNESQIPDEYNIKFSPSVGNHYPGTLRDLYKELNNLYITRPSGNTDNNKGGGDRVNKSGDARNRMTGHYHSMNNHTAAPSQIDSKIKHEMTSTGQFQQYRNTAYHDVGNAGFNPASNVNYNSPYINIGFIMKNPSTWL